MKKVIWKFELSVDNLSIEMPKGAEILSVQVQNNKPCIWALVDPKAPMKEKVIEVFGTGKEVPCDGISRTFIGTFQLQDGMWVFHLFERI